jgi:hypothetical protein
MSMKFPVLEVFNYKFSYLNRYRITQVSGVNNFLIIMLIQDAKIRGEWIAFIHLFAFFAIFMEQCSKIYDRITLKVNSLEIKVHLIHLT